jgi:large subunit ribosomal protein L24
MGTARKPHSLRIRRGDSVRVISGEDKGKDGRVLRVLREDRKVVVEGVNLVYRHVRRSQKHPQGGRVRREAPIDASNVMLLDPSDHVPTKVGKRVDDAGKRIRFARKTGKPVDEGSGKKGRKSKE